MPIGSKLFTIEVDDTGRQSPDSAVDTPQRAPSTSPEASSTESEGSGDERKRVVRTSPATRKLALELGVDLVEIVGSGPRGRINREDVETAARDHTVDMVEPPSGTGGSEVTSGTSVPLRGLRRQVAESMTASWTKIPHITEIREIQAGELVRAYSVLKAAASRRDEPFTLMTLFVKSVACALRKHPEFNASIDMERRIIEYKQRCNIGIATATADGLIVPVLEDADCQSLLAIARQLKSLSSMAQERKLAPHQTRNGTFTITNYGTFGSWIGTPLIRWPEVAIAGFGSIRDSVVPIDGVPAVRPVLPVSISADHRLLDGEHLARFVGTIADLLSDPITLLLGGEE